jgi:hypothetical protein
LQTWHHVIFFRRSIIGAATQNKKARNAIALCRREHKAFDAEGRNCDALTALALGALPTGAAIPAKSALAHQEQAFQAPFGVELPVSFQSSDDNGSILAALK